ncbi:YdcF family protein [Herbaspirillum sp. NPDC087042]|uniref:YdcF family protein n=1 Tax=Herbaspirillum sp. NPDC087042 TaxID=3364004 RepID=UPI00382AAC22
MLCIPAVSNLLVQPLENQTTVLTPAARSQGQAIVVLAAGSEDHAPEYDGMDIPDYVALARLRYAARLQHQTKLPILVSGGNAPADAPQRSKAEAMARALREDFATPVRWIEGRSENTEQNASYSAALLREDGVERVLLVTDAMHMPRAVMAFEHAGLHAIAAPTMFFRLDHLEPQSLLPSAEGLRRAYYASYEWLGLLWYRLRMNANHPS